MIELSSIRRGKNEGCIKEIQAYVPNTDLFTPLKEEAKAFRNRATASWYMPPTPPLIHPDPSSPQT